MASTTTTRARPRTPAARTDDRRVQVILAAVADFHRQAVRAYVLTDKGAAAVAATRPL